MLFDLTSRTHFALGAGPFVHLL